MPTLICRNEIRCNAGKNTAMFDPPSGPEIYGVGQRRASLGTIVAICIVLAGIVAVIAIIIAYGFMGTL